MKFRVVKSRWWFMVSMLLVSVLALAACTFEIQPPPPASGQPSEETPVASGEGEEAGLSLIQLRNATYSGIYDEPVTLTDGLYEGEPFVEGGAARPTVELVDDIVMRGDLNGDGVADAAVILVESSGASGVFNYLAVQLNDGGEPFDAGSYMLGDRVQLISVQITDGEIVVQLVTQGPDEPLCCGTLKVRQTFALQDGRLAMNGAEELGTVSLEDVRGTSWTLTALDLDQPVAEDLPPITLYFDDEGISGSAGCNSYRASVSSEGGQLLQVAPIITTRMACAADILEQETAYLEALGSATQWSYLASQLAISYQPSDDAFGTLLFERIAGAQSAETDDVQTANTIDVVFQCPDGTQIPVSFDNTNDVALVTLPDGVVELPRALSGSGARYSNATVTLWNNGDEVTIEIDGETVYEGCVAQDG